MGQGTYSAVQDLGLCLVDRVEDALGDNGRIFNTRCDACRARTMAFAIQRLWRLQSRRRSHFCDDGKMKKALRHKSAAWSAVSCRYKTPMFMELGRGNSSRYSRKRGGHATSPRSRALHLWVAPARGAMVQSGTRGRDWTHPRLPGRQKEDKGEPYRSDPKNPGQMEASWCLDEENIGESVFLPLIWGSR